MTTDLEWEKWGARDPYYGVLTHPKYRKAALDEQSRQEFFSLGELHAADVLQHCRARLDPGFQPRRILDFGCGVARVLIPFARMCEEAVGVDVSPSMLAEARRNCEAAGVANVALLASDDELSLVQGDFDLVHSAIVLQHIEISRGLPILERLIDKVRPGGIGVLQITFAWDWYDANLGVAPPPAPPVAPPRWSGLRDWLPRRTPPAASPPSPEEPSDPEMQMNFYNLSQVMYLLSRAGIQRVHSEMTNHGGCIGCFLYFQKPVVIRSDELAEEKTTR